MYRVSCQVVLTNKKIVVYFFFYFSCIKYENRQNFIDSYLAEKEAIRRQKEHEDYVKNCAIKIQSWWRGVMVRRKLGPYRPEDKRRKRQAKYKK